MNLVKSIRKQLATDMAITIIRSDQLGDIPDLPYATYKVISDRKGVGQEDVSHVDNVAALVETRKQERNTTLSINIYGTSHDNAYEVATQLRKWFEWRGSLFLDEINVAVVNLTDVTNRTTFLLESYDEKWGFDAIIRYQEIDEHEIDYFDKVEVEMKLGR